MNVTVEMDQATWHIVLSHLLDTKEHTMLDSDLDCRVLNTKQELCLIAKLKE